MSLKKSLTTKLILMLCVFSILLVGSMAIATRLHFQKGFLEYLTDAELEHLEPVANKLLADYKKTGSWAFVAKQHFVWMSYLPHKNKTLKHPPKASTLKAYRSDLPPHERPQGMAPPPPPPGDTAGISTRLRLIDADKNRVVGPPDQTGHPAFKALTIDGVVVGYLSLSPTSLPIDGIDDRFKDEQISAIYPIALGAFLFAILIGIPIGRRMLMPVKAVAAGAHRLAQGEFQTRIDVHGKDELGQLANDFNMLASALERNEVLRRQGMADISHELRTPLALVRGEIEAMQDGIRPLDQKQLGKLHHSALQLNSLVDDLYDLALTDAGALNYRKEEFDFAQMLGQATTGAEHSLSQAGLSLSVELPDSLMMFGDAKRLRQVIDNLLKNSRRYTDRSGTIAVSAWQRDDQAFLRVEDSAPGVDADLLPRLFERFYREEVSRNRATGGAGLGLAICRNIVEAHQGDIQAKQSELGGLTITISLPLQSGDRV